MSLSLMLSWMWNNRKLLSEIVGVILLLGALYWAFIYNPKVIDGLQEDKKELSRQIESWKEVQKFQEGVIKSNARIDKATFQNISTIKARTIPKRTVIITGGVPLPSVR